MKLIHSLALSSLLAASILPAYAREVAPATYASTKPLSNAKATVASEGMPTPDMPTKPQPQPQPKPKFTQSTIASEALPTPDMPTKPQPTPPKG
ncbi:MAG TPA: hypothetical protein VGD59_04795 [Acidisarcina sp.]